MISWTSAQYPQHQTTEIIQKKKYSTDNLTILQVQVMCHVALDNTTYVYWARVHDRDDLMIRV